MAEIEAFGRRRPKNMSGAEKQADYMKRVGLAHIEKVTTRTLQRDVRRFNQRLGRGDFLRMSMHVKPSPPQLVVANRGG